MLTHDQEYAREYVRLSLLGVNNINDLEECSKVLPPAKGSFAAADQDLVDAWLDSTEVVEEVADAVLDGDLLTGLRGVVETLGKEFGRHGRKLARAFFA